MQQYTDLLDPAQDVPIRRSVSKEHAITALVTYDKINPAPHLAAPIQISQDQLSNAFHVPNYIRPIPSIMAVDDLVLLADRGVFRLPEPTLRNELLRQYANYVYPLLPLMDLREFLTAIDSDDGHCQISLMLFYAVLSAASSFLDIHLLQAAGFADRKAARKAFFQRAKVRMFTISPKT